MPRFPAGLPSFLLGATLLQACATAEHGAMRSALDRGEIRPISDIIALAEGRYLGRVVEAELEPLGLAWAYEVTLLPPRGGAFEVTLDATTGAFLGAQGLVQARGR